MLAALLLSLSLPTAAAAEASWAVGPTVDTIVLPGRYPSKYAPDAQSAGGFESLRGDTSLGVRGVIRPSDYNRFGARARYGFGAEGYRNATFSLEYDRYLLDQNGFYVAGGGGLGAGTLRFKSASDHILKMTTYLFRAQTGAGYTLDGYGGEVAFNYTVVVPGVQTLVGPGGGESEVKGGYYGQFGVEATAFFGPLRR